MSTGNWNEFFMTGSLNSCVDFLRAMRTETKSNCLYHFFVLYINLYIISRPNFGHNILGSHFLLPKLLRWTSSSNLQVHPELISDLTVNGDFIPSNTIFEAGGMLGSGLRKRKTASQNVTVSIVTDFFNLWRFRFVVLETINFIL